MPTQYIVNDRTKRKFRIMKFDKATNKITLRGDLGEFEEDFDKAKLKTLGYRLETVDESEDEQENA